MWYHLGDNFQSSGWVLKNWVPDGTNPGDVNNFSALTNVAAQVDLYQFLDGGIATTGNIYAGVTPQPLGLRWVPWSFRNPHVAKFW